MKSLIQKLTEIFAPSGNEAPVRDVIRAEVEPLADEVCVDALGNLIVRKGTKTADGKKIMIAAHMDEIGLIVTHVDANGFVRFTGLGVVFPQYVLGGRVRFLNGTHGVIAAESFGALREIPSFDKLYIDVGATSRKDCPVKVGDVAGFERSFLDLGRRFVAKSMDDRIGCAVAIEALRALKSTPHEVHFVFSAQEEVGSRGAGTAAYGLDPDLGFAVDVTTWGDTPNFAPHFEMALGKGPAIKVRDTGMIADPRIVAWMVSSAEENQLPYQREVLVGGTTDARSMQLARAGIPVGCLSIPCRYVHSPSEMVDFDDVQNAVKLIVALLSAPVDFL